MMMWVKLCCPWLKEIRVFEFGEDEDCNFVFFFYFFLLLHLTVLVIVD